jgi:hypothetical protein
VFWFGLAALRGRVGKGFGEIAVSFALAAILGAVLANPGGVLLDDTGLVGRAKDIGVDVAVTAVQAPDQEPAPCVQRAPVAGESLVDGCYIDEFGGGEPPTRNDPQYLRWIMQMWLVDMYVRRPHQHMTYGQRLDCPLVLQVRGSEENPDASSCAAPYEDGGNHPCVDQYNLILLTNPATAPEAAGANPESYMYDMMHPDEPVEGCAEGEELAAYLDRGTGDRVVVGALLLFTLLILGAFLLIGVILPLVIGQLMVAILAVALIFVLPLVASTLAGQTPVTELVLFVILIALAAWPAFAIVAIAGKWAIIGRFRPGQYPLWGSYYLRWWMVSWLQSVATTWCPMCASAAAVGSPTCPVRMTANFMQSPSSRRADCSGGAHG